MSNSKKSINQINHQCGVLYKDVLLRMVVKQRCAMVDPSLGKSESSSYELAIDTRRTKDEQIYYLCIASTYSLEYYAYDITLLASINNLQYC